MLVSCLHYHILHGEHRHLRLLQEEAGTMAVLCTSTDEAASYKRPSQTSCELEKKEREKERVCESMGYLKRLRESERERDGGKGVIISSL